MPADSKQASAHWGRCLKKLVKLMTFSLDVRSLKRSGNKHRKLQARTEAMNWRDSTVLPTAHNQTKRDCWNLD